MLINMMRRFGSRIGRIPYNVWYNRTYGLKDETGEYLVDELGNVITSQ